MRVAVTIVLNEAERKKLTQLAKSRTTSVRLARRAQIVLLAAAVSPTFDIRPAAAHVERAIWNYHSKFDWFFLEFRHHSVGDAGRPTGLRRWGVRIPRSRNRRGRCVRPPDPATLALADAEPVQSGRTLRLCPPRLRRGRYRAADPSG